MSIFFEISVIFFEEFFVEMFKFERFHNLWGVFTRFL